MMKIWTRVFKKKYYHEITLKLHKIECLNISESLNFVDFSIVWSRGPQESECIQGQGLNGCYELNYIENNSYLGRNSNLCPLSSDTSECPETFKRISGFYYKDKI